MGPTTEKTLSGATVWKWTSKTGRPLVIIAEDADGEALATLVGNKLRGTLRIAAVKAPSCGDRRKAMLEYIATLTGATLVSDDLGQKLESVGLAQLGTAKKITIDNDNTTIVDCVGENTDINARVKQVKKEIENTTSDCDKEKLQERLAKMLGGVAIIKVGAVTETEMKANKDRVENALASTRAAVEEGIVPGGGVALLRAQAALENLKFGNEHDFGVKIVRRAIEEPLRRILTSADIEASPVVEKIRDSRDGFGFNALTEQYEDLTKAGVIDPTKVTKLALVNAVSVAGLLLTTEAMIAEKPAEQRGVWRAGHDHDMM